MGLDFVYGDVKDGVLRPLDGQQRLTTLFLLHWYVASLAGRTRPGRALAALLLRDAPDRARLQPRPSPSTRIRADRRPRRTWITDQPWYLYPWRQDPTISSMLVMLDAIHDAARPRTRPTSTRCGLGSRNASTRQAQAIWFLFLPVVDMDYGEDLYIKMNSRGKPLTTFEVFKADFESIIKAAADPGRPQSTSSTASTALGGHSSGSTRRRSAATSRSTTSSSGT